MDSSFSHTSFISDRSFVSDRSSVLERSSAYTNNSWLSVEKFWFTNTLLLGFDAGQNEKKYKIPFTHDMFRHLNVKGMEVVLHFLFCHLYPARMNELLKYVWPINDQTQGKDFKKIIIGLVEELKDKLDLASNSIASTIQSCFGKRFYDLLWKLSHYALQVTMQKEFPNYPMPTFPALGPHANAQKAEDLTTALQLHIARQARMFVSHAQRAVTAEENWRRLDQAMYNEHTALTEELNGIKKELAELGTQHDLSQLNSAEAQETRKKRIENIRQMWQVAENFNTQVTNNTDIYSDVLSGNAYPHQLRASDLHIAKIPEELAGVAGPLLLPTTNDINAPQFTLDGLLTLFSATLTQFSRLLPPANPPLKVATEAPRLAEWAKTQTQQLTAIEAFEVELTQQAVAWRKELQEAVAVRASIDSAVHDRIDDRQFSMQTLPPPASYVGDQSILEKREITSSGLGFASPASRAPKQDVLEKLANSVKRVALRGSRTFAAISNELLPPDFGSEPQDFSFSTMSTINPDSFFVSPSTPASSSQQSASKNRRLTSTAQGRQSIMNAPLYNKPQPTPSTTSRNTTKPKPKPVPKLSASSSTRSVQSTPYATSNDSSALNLSSIFSQQKQDKQATRKPTGTKPLPPTTTSTSISTSPPSNLHLAFKKAAPQKKNAAKPRPSAMDLLVNDLAAYIGDNEMLGYDEDEEVQQSKSSKPKPSGLRTGPTSHVKTPKKKLAWAETPSDLLHAHTNILEAIDGTAFQTTKQLPRTPLIKNQLVTPVTSSQTQGNTSPVNFFDDNNNNSLTSDDVEWNQFINTAHNNSPNKLLRNTKTNTKLSTSPFASNTNTHTHANGKTRTSPLKTTPKSHNHEHTDTMDYDLGVDSPMHMTDWLSSSSSPTPSSSIFPVDSLNPFSSNHSLSNNLLTKDTRNSTSPHRDENHSIFATPADREYR